MISNRISHVALDDVRIERSERQRSDLTPESVLDLACSIARNQWISPILVDQDTNLIIAGERRHTAVSVLRAAMNGDYSMFENEAAAREALAPVCTCQVDSWNNWERIPAQLARDLTDSELQIFEFIENFQRQDLPWQDKAAAIYKLHAINTTGDPKWSNAKTGSQLGIDHTTVAKNLRVWRVMEDKPTDEVRLIISEAPTLNSAFQHLQRYMSRREDEVITLAGGKAIPKSERDKPTQPIVGKPGPAPGTPPNRGVPDIDIDEDEDEDWDVTPGEYDSEPDTSLSSNLHNADFLTWAAAYTGPQFNFIHCDFPYGINFNTGEQGKGVAGALKGDYDDSPEVYWSLLSALAANRDRLIHDSCHIMFWHSPAMYLETLDYMTGTFPDATIQPFNMIWHCSDQDGIVPDPNRYGRRTYETAMLLTFGDRKIVSPVSLSTAHPRESRTRIHRSQKPLPVLSHFFSMFIDDASRFLDPTAGSGTSLLAAHHAGASYIQGIELDADTHSRACEYLDARSESIRL